MDLNADVGESFGAWTLGDDAGVLASVSSANIACGFHAGDPLTMRATLELAAARGVTVGAHVAYRDLAGFGRRFMDVDPGELAAEVLYQIGALDALARAAGTRVSYVKPHGALYNAIVHHEAQAGAVVDGVRAFSRSLPLLLLPGSVALEKARAAGLRGVGEAFADRGYLPDGTLVPRSQEGAVMHDAGAVSQRVLQFATEGTLVAVDGTVLRPDAESVCLHGDTPGAVSMATAVRTALETAGVAVESFV